MGGAGPLGQREQPLRIVVEQWTEGGHYAPLRQLERLECGHVVAAATKGWSRRRRCAQCPPVERTPIVVWQGWPCS